MRWLVICAAIGLAACAPAVTSGTGDALPKTACATPPETRKALRETFGYDLAALTPYPCSKHVLDFRGREVRRRTGAILADTESDTMWIKFGLFDSTSGFTVNDWYTTYKNSWFRFEHSEGRETVEYRGYTIVNSRIRHSGAGATLPVSAVVLPLSTCYEFLDHCYDNLVWLIFSKSSGKELHDMPAIARAFVDGLSAR